MTKAKMFDAWAADLRQGAWQDVLDDVRADLIVTSPPYNIGSRSARIDGRRRSGRYDPKSFGAIRSYSDSLSEAEYQRGQVEFLRWCAEHISPNGVVVYNHKPRRRDKRIIHPMEWIARVSELALTEEIVWDRGSTHNHDKSMMWYQTERLYVLRRPDGAYPLVNTSASALPQRSDVWRIGRPSRSSHDAAFPEELVEACLLAWSGRGDVVCDPYSGSGTVAVVARRLGRRFVGAELDLGHHAAAMARVGMCLDVRRAA